MSDDHVMTWEEMQRLALPPNSTMLVPPPPDVVEVPALAAGPPPKPDWLDDGFTAGEITIDPDANRAAAEREEHGPGAVRLLANMIAVGAVLEYANSPPKKEDDEETPQRSPKPQPEVP